MQLCLQKHQLYKVIFLKNKMNTQTQHNTQYKNSSLGLIPDDWEIIEFGEFAERGKNQYVPKLNENLKCLELEHFEQGTGNILGYVNSSEQKSNKNKFVEGQVLFGKLRPYLKKYWLTEFEGVCSSEVWVLNSKSKKCTNEFIFRLVQSNRFIQVANVSSGSKMPRADWDYVSNFPFSIPPLPEQKAIANCLSTWDIAIEKHTALIAQKELAKKALMQQLLSGKKRLKGFSGKWHLKSLEEVATFKNGKAHENGIDENGDYKVVNSKFVSTNGNVFKSSNDNLCPLFINEIAMVMSDIPNGKALAKCFYVTENNKYTLNQRICSIRANNETDSKFLYYILNRNVHYLSFDNGVGQTNLKKEEVLECPLLMPEKEEQTAIANVLQCADTEIQLLKNKLAQLKEQKKGLMQVLLTGKKRLKI